VTTGAGGFGVLSLRTSGRRGASPLQQNGRQPSGGLPQSLGSCGPRPAICCPLSGPSRLFNPRRPNDSLHLPAICTPYAVSLILWRRGKIKTRILTIKNNKCGDLCRKLSEAHLCHAGPDPRYTLLFDENGRPSLTPCLSVRIKRDGRLCHVLSLNSPNFKVVGIDGGACSLACILSPHRLFTQLQ